MDGRGPRNPAGVLAPRPPLPSPILSLISQQSSRLLGLRSPAVTVVHYILLIGLKSIDPRLKIADALFQVSESLRLNPERDGERVALR